MGRYDVVIPDGVIMSSLKVIGAGSSRTGTRSLKYALEILYSDETHASKCYHADEWLGNYSHIKEWGRFFHQKLASASSASNPGGSRGGAMAEPKLDFGLLFIGHDCAVDAPIYVVYKELLAKYPSAKVILT